MAASTSSKACGARTTWSRWSGRTGLSPRPLASNRTQRTPAAAQRRERVTQRRLGPTCQSFPLFKKRTVGPLDARSDVVTMPKRPTGPIATSSSRSRTPSLPSHSARAGCAHTRTGRRGPLWTAPSQATIASVVSRGTSLWSGSTPRSAGCPMAGRRSTAAQASGSTRSTGGGCSSRVRTSRCSTAGSLAAGTRSAARSAAVSARKTNPGSSVPAESDGDGTLVRSRCSALCSFMNARPDGQGSHNTSACTSLLPGGRHRAQQGTHPHAEDRDLFGAAGAGERHRVADAVEPRLDAPGIVVGPRRVARAVVIETHGEQPVLGQRLGQLAVGVVDARVLAGEGRAQDDGPAAGLGIGDVDPPEEGTMRWPKPPSDRRGHQDSLVPTNLADVVEFIDRTVPTGGITGDSKLSALSSIRRVAPGAR